jgi:hypothetical protein
MPASTAGFVEKNAVSFLVLGSATGSWPSEEGFLMPLDLGFFLIAMEPGLRPAPGR